MMPGMDRRSTSSVTGRKPPATLPWMNHVLGKPDFAQRYSVLPDVSSARKRLEVDTDDEGENRQVENTQRKETTGEVIFDPRPNMAKNTIDIPEPKTTTNGSYNGTVHDVRGDVPMTRVDSTLTTTMGRDRSLYGKSASAVLPGIRPSSSVAGTRNNVEDTPNDKQVNKMQRERGNGSDLNHRLGNVVSTNIIPNNDTAMPIENRLTQNTSGQLKGAKQAAVPGDVPIACVDRTFPTSINKDMSLYGKSSVLPGIAASNMADRKIIDDDTDNGSPTTQKHRGRKGDGVISLVGHVHTNGIPTINSAVSVENEISKNTGERFKDVCDVPIAFVDRTAVSSTVRDLSLYGRSTSTVLPDIKSKDQNEQQNTGGMMQRGDSSHSLNTNDLNATNGQKADTVLEKQASHEKASNESDFQNEANINELYSLSKSNTSIRKEGSIKIAEEKIAAMLIHESCSNERQQQDNKTDMCNTENELDADLSKHNESDVKTGLESTTPHEANVRNGINEAIAGGVKTLPDSGRELGSRTNELFVSELDKSISRMGSKDNTIEQDIKYVDTLNNKNDKLGVQTHEDDRKYNNNINEETHADTDTMESSTDVQSQGKSLSSDTTISKRNVIIVEPESIKRQRRKKKSQCEKFRNAIQCVTSKNEESEDSSQTSTDKTKSGNDFDTNLFDKSDVLDKNVCLHGQPDKENFITKPMPSKISVKRVTFADEPIIHTIKPLHVLRKELRKKREDGDSTDDLTYDTDEDIAQISDTILNDDDEDETDCVDDTEEVTQNVSTDVDPGAEDQHGWKHHNDAKDQTKETLGHCDGQSRKNSVKSISKMNATDQDVDSSFKDIEVSTLLQNGNTRRTIDDKSCREVCIYCGSVKKTRHTEDLVRRDVFTDDKHVKQNLTDIPRKDKHEPKKRRKMSKSSKQYFYDDVYRKLMEIIETKIGLEGRDSLMRSKTITEMVRNLNINPCKYGLMYAQLIKLRETNPYINIIKLITDPTMVIEDADSSNVIDNGSPTMGDQRGPSKVNDDKRPTWIINDRGLTKVADDRGPYLTDRDPKWEFCDRDYGLDDRPTLSHGESQSVLISMTQSAKRQTPSGLEHINRDTENSNGKTDESELKDNEANRCQYKVGSFPKRQNKNSRIKSFFMKLICTGKPNVKD